MTDAIRTIASGPTDDAIFSNDGSVLYAMLGNTITAYSVASGAATGSWTVGTELGGMDITPDGQYLVVAERTAGATHENNPAISDDDTQDATLYRIGLSDSTTQSFTFALPRNFSTFPAGLYDVAALTNGHVLASTNDGYVANLDLAGGTFTTANPSTGKAAVFSISDDRSRILVGEQVSTTPPLQTFTRDGTRTASFTSGDGMSFQLNNKGIQAITSSGTLIAQSITYNFNIYDGSGHFLIDLVKLYPQWNASGKIAGLAFSSDDSSLFVLGDGTGLVTQLSTADWHIVNQFKTGVPSTVGMFPSSYLNSGFGNRIQASPDGHFLEVIGDTKLQLIDLQALPIDAATLYGTAYGDTITATAGHLTADGLGGNDVLSDGGVAGVTLIGGPGEDVFHVSVAGTVVVENDADAGSDTEYTAVSGTTIAAGVETLAFEAGGSGSLIGDARANTLRGGGGNDILSGGGGNDQLDGGGGADIAVINVARSAAAISVNANGSLVVTSGEGTDTLTNIETIRFTDQDLATSSLVIRGTAGDDTLTGGPGDELIQGLAGNDFLSGLAGNDTLDGGAGINTLDGGDGFDTAVIPVDREFASGQITDQGNLALLWFASGINIADLRNIEAVQFTDQTVVIGDLARIGTSDNDQLTASADGQAIGGLDGNDVLDAGDFVNIRASGGAGDDILITGLGFNMMTGGAGADTFRGTAGNLNGDTIVDFSTDDKIHITDASIANFTATLNGQTLAYTGGSLTLIATPRAISVMADPNGGVDIIASTRVVQNDFNGDGQSDILWRSNSGSFGDWLATGSGNFSPNPTILGVSTDWKIAGTGDFNGDGKTDVLWRNDNGQFGDWLATGSGNFSPNATLYSATTDWKIAGTGDFNGDGKTDLLWRNDSGTFGTWSVNSAGTGFTPNSTLYGVTTDWKIAGTGDFDGDGKSDILWRNTTTGQFGDWLSTGNGTFSPNATLGASPLNWHIAETGDFNGDGKTDILWRSDAGQVGTWFAGAGGNFTPNATLYGAPTDWKIVDVGDYNADGKDDILWRNSSTGQVGDWLSGGDGSFNPNANLYAAPLDWNVAGDHAFLV